MEYSSDEDQRENDTGGRDAGSLIMRKTVEGCCAPLTESSPSSFWAVQRWSEGHQSEHIRRRRSTGETMNTVKWLILLYRCTNGVKTHTPINGRWSCGSVLVSLLAQWLVLCPEWLEWKISAITRFFNQCSCQSVKITKRLCINTLMRVHSITSYIRCLLRHRAIAICCVATAESAGRTVKMQNSSQACTISWSPT